ncbi:MAG: chitobiase/beta-hexosaminidase C-terminal domain-containing protein [Prevotella sp.]|nr:chitobiase/beta-hexosaminidase C-terminal domain-containing protein [Prevotella sp.]
MKRNLRLLFAALLLMMGGTMSASVVTDELTWEGLGLVGSNSSYNDFADKTFSSPAVYAGQASSGTGSYIQLRDKNNNAGIITTTSGGKLKSVTVTFNGKTTDRSLSIYAKNTPYSAATDLYDADKQGEKLGDIAADADSKTLEVSGDYTYIGMRSASGAIYIDKIEIVWETEGPVQTTAARPTISPNGGSFDESIEVTLSHSNPDAEIYYAINEADFQHYAGPFTLTETTTVKAYAIDEECDIKQSPTVEATFTKNAPVQAIVATIAEFNAAEVSNDVWYQLTGVVKNLKDDDQYGNFDLEDETGSVYVYGLLSEKGGAKKQFQALAAEKGIQNGSKLTLIGNRGLYNEKIEVTNAYFVSVDNSGVQPIDPVELEGDGTKEKPYTVADVKAIKEFPADKVWVKGFIVGSIKNNAIEETPTQYSNIAIAAEAGITEWESVVPVQLVNNTDPRAQLNVVDNPGNIGKAVKLFGTIATYFSTNGVKDVSEFEMEGSTAISTMQATAKQGKVYNLQGQQVMQPTKGMYIINGKKVVLR